MKAIFEKLRLGTSSLWTASQPLALTGWLMIADFVMSLVAMWFDPRQITGIDAWLKPAKFGLSSAVTCFTLAWIGGYLKDWPKVRTWGGRVFAVSIAIEIVVINLQAARGTTSHFNVSTPFNKGAFIVMGISICTLLFSMTAMTYALLRQTVRPASWKWAIRLGLLLSLVGAAGGGFMLRQTPEQKLIPHSPIFGSHTVGAPDGGPGLAELNWSNQHGDLRIPHFLGLHAMQFIPLFGLWLLGRRGLSELERIRFVWLASCAYVDVFAMLTWQALRGQALLDPDGETLFAAILILTLIVSGSVVILGARLSGALNRWANILEVRA